MIEFELDPTSTDPRDLLRVALHIAAACTVSAFNAMRLERETIAHVFRLHSGRVSLEMQTQFDTRLQELAHDTAVIQKMQAGVADLLGRSGG